MSKQCPLSCGQCVACVDSASGCDQWAARGECQANAAFMRSNCARSCGMCASGAKAKAGGTQKAAVVPRGKEAPPRCVDEYKDCALWAMTGECQVSPMRACWPSCHS
jgi:hypothetical protein